MSETVRTLAAIQKLLNKEWVVARNPNTKETLTLYGTYTRLACKNSTRDINLSRITHVKDPFHISCLLPVDPEFLDKTWEEASDLEKPFDLEPLDAVAQLLVFPNALFEYDIDGVIHKMNWKELEAHGIPYKALTTKWRRVL